MKNIPLSLIYPILVTLVFSSVPFIFEFNSNDNISNTFVYKLDTTRINVIPSDIQLVKEISTSADSLYITTELPIPEVSNQIQIPFELGVIYCILFAIHVIVFLVFLFDDEKHNDTWLLNIPNCRYLPTKSNTFYFTINNSRDMIIVYKLHTLVLIYEDEYRIGDKNLTELLISISKELDEKYYSYELEEVKNWRAKN